MKKKLLVVDIGNTNIHIGFFENDKLLSAKTINKTTFSDKNSFFKKNFEPQIISISTVRPSLLKNIEKSLRKVYDCKVIKIPDNLDVPINVVYYNRKQLGVDRQLNAFAAFKIFKKGCFIISLGTAITVDAVDENANMYPGGIIPGKKLCGDSLQTRCELLPNTQLKKFFFALPKNTTEAIKFGISNFIIGGIEKILDTLKKYVKTEIIVSTGGDVDSFDNLFNYVNYTDKNLTLKGSMWVLKHYNEF